MCVIVCVVFFEFFYACAGLLRFGLEAFVDAGQADGVEVAAEVVARLLVVAEIEVCILAALEGCLCVSAEGDAVVLGGGFREEECAVIGNEVGFLDHSCGCFFFLSFVFRTKS